jgi:arylsulfatase A
MPLNRRNFIRTSASLAVGLPLLSACDSSTGAPPNVVLVLTDDQGFGDVPRNGNQYLDTPVLDRFADQGACLQRFYVSPVCAPTRAALLTGRYPWRCGVTGVTRGRETMRLDEVTIADLFGRAGYATGCFGKWHNGAHYPYHPMGRGFDRFLGFCAGHWNNYFDTRLDADGQMIETGGYIADVLTDGAIDFIRHNADNPFFLYLPYNTPHSPFQVPDEFYDKYFARTGDPTLATIYGMIDNMDGNFGRVLSTLEETGVRRNTIVVFITDNGPQTERFNAGLRERKGSVYDGGTRVPCYIQWPGHIKPGTVVDHPCGHVDILPTLCAMAGVSRDGTQPLDGLDVTPLLTGDDIHWPDRKLYTGWGRRGALHTECWNVVVPHDGPPQLYDIPVDSGQRSDQAARHPDIAAGLAAAYTNWKTDAQSGGLEVPPAPLGYEGWPLALPGHEAGLSGEFSYHGRSGWANDWVQNIGGGGAAEWKIDVVEPGEYEISLDYVCPQEEVGTTLQVEIAGQSVSGEVEKAHDPPYLPSPDRVERIEVYEKEWAVLPLGSLNLARGLATVSLTAPGKQHPGGIQVKTVRIRRAG